jgi:hypothetical protein
MRSPISIDSPVTGRVLRGPSQAWITKPDFGTPFEGRKAIMKRLLGFVIPAILLCGMRDEGAAAQVSDTSQTSATKFAGWDASNSNTPDVTVTAIIEQAVADHAGGPGGSQLLLATPQGPLNVSVGPYLTKRAHQALSVGKQVRVTGKVENANGQTYLLAKQLFIDGQQIMIRNDHGSLVRTRQHARTYSQSLQNGELQ